MQLDNYQRLYYTFVESYIDQEHIWMKKDHQEQFSHTFPDIYIDQEYKKMQEKIYSIKEQIVL